MCGKGPQLRRSSHFMAVVGFAERFSANILSELLSLVFIPMMGDEAVLLVSAQNALLAS